MATTKSRDAEAGHLMAISESYGSYALRWSFQEVICRVMETPTGRYELPKDVTGPDPLIKSLAENLPEDTQQEQSTAKREHS